VVPDRNMALEIDKELLRLWLEGGGCDTSVIDMDLAIEYEKAKIAVERQEGVRL
jgi:hypothetical protein